MDRNIPVIYTTLYKLLDMLHDSQRFLDLLGKYTSDEITSVERSELFQYIVSGKYDKALSVYVEQQLLNKEISGASLTPQRAHEIVQNILSAEKHTSKIIPFTKKVSIFHWMIAASIVVFITFSTYFLLSGSSSLSTKNFDAKADTKLSKELNVKVNNSSNPLTLKMEDGSIITLQPGSKVTYPLHFSGEKREVYLDGEAFFEISKNPKRPFYVYYENLVTRVLGTSFNIKINKQKHQMEVDVRTGRVEVYDRTALRKNENSRVSNGVILTPNQKVIYKFENKQFESSIVDVPLPIPGPINANVVAQGNIKDSFIFDGTPLATILTSLEKTYGIDIEVENDNINSCLFTGDISSQNLYVKLDILCQSLKASYEIEGTKILIRGKGCN